MWLIMPAFNGYCSESAVHVLVLHISAFLPPKLLIYMYLIPVHVLLFLNSSHAPTECEEYLHCSYSKNMWQQQIPCGVILYHKTMKCYHIPRLYTCTLYPLHVCLHSYKCWTCQIITITVSLYVYVCYAQS